jgi:hypothetical protein
LEARIASSEGVVMDDDRNASRRLLEWLERPLQLDPSRFERARAATTYEEDLAPLVERFGRDVRAAFGWTPGQAKDASLGHALLTLAWLGVHQPLLGLAWMPSRRLPVSRIRVVSCAAAGDVIPVGASTATIRVVRRNDRGGRLCVLLLVAETRWTITYDGRSLVSIKKAGPGSHPATWPSGPVLDPTQPAFDAMWDGFDTGELDEEVGALGAVARQEFGGLFRLALHDADLGGALLAMATSVAGDLDVDEGVAVSCDVVPDDEDLTAGQQIRVFREADVDGGLRLRLYAGEAGWTVGFRDRRLDSVSPL